MSEYEIKSTFKRQIYLCSGIGYETMIQLINEQFNKSDILYQNKRLIEMAKASLPVLRNMTSLEGLNLGAKKAQEMLDEIEGFCK